jgi:2-oxoglutarate ferredoxin oxidoreductase subunit beta
MAKLAAAAGANYVARWTTAHPNQLKDAIKKAIHAKGFRFIEAVSQCPTAYGRKVGFRDAGEMIKWFRENAITIEQAEKLNEDGLAQKIVVGEFVERKRPTFVEAVYRIIEEAQKAEEN